MKLVATILVAALVVAGGMSFAFAECAGHSKAQMVKSDDPQVSAGQQANNDAPAAVSDKAAQPDKVAQKVTDPQEREKK
jgi:hypothetical protein